MKVFTTLLIALAIALGVYAARRRIVFALKVGALVYLVLLPLRLLFAAGSLADRAEDLVWPLFLLGATWLVLWYASTRYERRHRDRPRQPLPSGRRPRFRLR
jgi:hypothetical protein